MQSIIILYILIAFFASIAVAYFQYLYKVKTKAKKGTLLFILKSISLFLLLLLIINPKITTTTLENSKPTLSILVDNSKSISFFNEQQNVIDFITITTLGNAIDFGDLAVARLGAAGSNSSTKGLFSGGQPASPIESINIGSLGNSINFGDLATNRAYLGSTDNGIKSITYAGSAEDTDSTKHNQIEQVQIASEGNAVDFGDATSSRNATQGTISNGHGGLALTS